MFSYVAAGFSVAFMQPLKASAEAFQTITTGEIFDADSGVITDNAAGLSGKYDPDIILQQTQDINEVRELLLPLVFGSFFFLAFFGAAAYGY